MNQFIPRVVSIIFCLAGVLGFWGFGVLGLLQKKAKAG